MRANCFVLLGAILFGTIAEVSSAAEEKSAASPCVFVDQISHFQYLDDKTALLEVSPSKSFKVTFFNTCRELKWAVSARIEARPGICLGKGDKIVVARDHGVAEHCVVNAIEAMPAKVPVSTSSQ
jgi:hypothetical protein